MSQPSLNWEFNDEHEVLDEGRPTPPRRSIAWRKLLMGLGVGLLVLAAAGIGGFAIGRFQRSTTAARTDIQAALDIETWAWQSSNRQLFASSLDMGARSDWRRALERQFESTGKDIKAVTLRDFRFIDTELVQVEVDVVGPQGVQKETRHYRLINGQWRRTSRN